MHKDLLVWKKTEELVLLTYQFTQKLPNEEKFGLVSQMRRSAISILSNIAEGAARNTTKEYCRFLYIALGSSSELEAQYSICVKLGLAKGNDEFTDRIDYVNKLLIRQINSLKKKMRSF